MTTPRLVAHAFSKETFKVGGVGDYNVVQTTTSLHWTHATHIPVVGKLPCRIFGLLPKGGGIHVLLFPQNSQHSKLAFEKLFACIKVAEKKCATLFSEKEYTIVSSAKRLKNQTRVLRFAVSTTGGVAVHYKGKTIYLTQDNIKKQLAALRHCDIMVHYDNAPTYVTTTVGSSCDKATLVWSIVNFVG